MVNFQQFVSPDGSSTLGLGRYVDGVDAPRCAFPSPARDTEVLSSSLLLGMGVGELIFMRRAKDNTETIDLETIVGWRQHAYLSDNNITKAAQFMT
ncbi:hypothetical protein CLCR_06472 [Cladophialophora carrionii]|uniref:Uncharacterized protein n=1 Tax=Cladophialophora carrionii TaxID=86049 RepID=A0A1C1C9H6_9EURO|nr:hypothetical protein CLCR_06472 [Cladophialophora carrionii]